MARQEQNENLTEAGAGLCGRHWDHQDLQPAGRKSRELTDNSRGAATPISSLRRPPPGSWAAEPGLRPGGAAIAAIAPGAGERRTMSVPYLVGIMLFVFDLFGPIKALYTQATRLDRHEQLHGPDRGGLSRAGAAGFAGTHPETAKPGGGVPACALCLRGERGIARHLLLPAPAPDAGPGGFSGGANPPSPTCSPVFGT